MVVPESHDTPAVLYIDLHLIHEVTSPQAFDVLRARGLTVHRPDRTVGTMDHSTPTGPRNALGKYAYADTQAESQVNKFAQNCAEFGLEMHALGEKGQGIVHVIGPERGLTQPGKTIVCGDSHTSTHGAFGALAFGIGTTEVGYVLATQCLLQRKPRTMEVRIDGALPRGVTAKDMILAIIRKIGVAGGTGHVIEYTGSAIRNMNMDQRMTVCNMSIEAGARAGMVAPDDVTFAYLHGRHASPKGHAWDEAVNAWRALCSDGDARYDRSISLDASLLEPMVTFGVDPSMGIGISEVVPSHGIPGLQDALAYMGIEPGRPLKGHPIQVAFVGSCTNSRISDIRAAADILKGRRVAEGVRCLVVPGSQQIKQEAESLGLHDVIRAAGAEWREPGCSMCIGMNGDIVPPGQYAISTSNRNFKGRQGPGSRTFLASPEMVAASAVMGVVTDPREVLP